MSLWMKGAGHMQNPNSEFSVYDLYTKQKESTEIFYEKRQIFSDWCANVERTLVQYELNVDHIFVSFQVLEFFLSVQDRYRQMAQYANHIWVFGTPLEDKILPEIDGVHYIFLEPADTLAKEWFLIVNHPTFSRSLSAIGPSDDDDIPLDERYYKAILTEKPTQIQPVYDQLLATYAKPCKL